MSGMTEARVSGFGTGGFISCVLDELFRVVRNYGTDLYGDRCPTNDREAAELSAYNTSVIEFCNIFAW